MLTNVTVLVNDYFLPAGHRHIVCGETAWFTDMTAIMKEEFGPQGVLVTGASGYLASHVVQQLLQDGYQVRGTVRSLTNPLKVDPLKKLGEEAENRLELVEADLTNEECWKDAIEGCTYVCHTASPFPMATPADENEIIKPAVDGTLRVLKACTGKVKRVVLTSSVAAVGEVHSTGVKMTEADWTDLSKPNVDPYTKSKTLAEKAAWDYVDSLGDDDKFEMAVINPAFILGPVLTQQGGTSIDAIRRLMSGKDPMLPRVAFSVVDVRDVAKAHVVAMTLPEAAGHRHIVCGETAWFTDMTAIMKEEFGPQGYNPTTRTMPRMLCTILSFFDSSMRLVKDRWEIVTSFDNTRMREVLKIEPIQPKPCIIEMVYSLIELGRIHKTPQYKGRPASQ
ncbi:putative NADPH-dependent methylglyoxal reductase GRP2 [Apostichopus japonicus]|uniref:Putative NADPH-dependent methylglyoxal reductase GRP2 n=1 Tax=Stichopus japonicus TaxID=307972 RepID=A0A2G8L779_STIJA|nr:putative NADPH-dependent methylglyoxal reductase GRP2 [Apostichopus japonicus]